MSGPRAGPERWLGRVVSGCVLERHLGAGAMGSVFQAHRAEDFQPVVVKLMAEDAARDPHLRLRFAREGLALQRLPPHPNVVGIFAVDPDHDPPCLVLEFVAGQPFDEVLRTQGPLDPLEVARVGRDVAQGLSAVHRRGLLHRDIKPANLIRGAQGRTTIVDFGLARDDFRTGITDQGALLGTSFYIAPEAWESPAASPACDLFALGVTLYQLATGRPPFLGAELDQIMEAIQTGRYELPRSVRPEIPLALEHVLLQLLMSEPRFRYGRAEDVADDLERVLHGQPCLTPGLVDAAGRRYPCLIGKRFLIGSGEEAAVRLADPSVAPAHAEIRRKRSYQLADLKSPQGTFVDGAAVARRCELHDGAEVRVGAVVLRFEDPRSRARAPSFLNDLERLRRPEVVVRALISAGDPRATAALLEQVAPDPYAESRARRQLATALGPAAGEAALGRWRASRAQASAWSRRYLAQLAQADLGPEPAPWLAWWDRARLQWPERFQVQVGSEPPRDLGIAARAPAAALAATLLGERGVQLLGRDPRCHLRLEGAGVDRLEAVLLRLHGRWVLRREGANLSYAFCDPGQAFTLGGVELELRAEAGGAGGGHVDAEVLSLLAEARHPSVASALVGWVALAAQGASAQGASAQGASALPQPCGALGARVAQQLELALAEQATRARSVLTHLLGEDRALDVAGWRALLAQHEARLGPQV